MKLRQTDLAYLAGFFDGEGSVMLSLNKSQGLSAGVSCSQNTQNVMYLFKRAFGGNVYSYVPKGRKRRIYQWRANGQVAIDFINLVHPWLIIKLFVAEEALAAWPTRKDKPVTAAKVAAHKKRLKEERDAS